MMSRAGMQHGTSSCGLPVSELRFSPQLSEISPIKNKIAICIHGFHHSCRPFDKLCPLDMPVQIYIY
jgi:calcineurin-like phosphoesterase family protein